MTLHVDIKALRNRRGELTEQLEHEEDERNKLEQKVRLLEEQLVTREEQIERRRRVLRELDETLNEAEQAYQKVFGFKNCSE